MRKDCCAMTYVLRINAMSLLLPYPDILLSLMKLLYDFYLKILLIKFSFSNKFLLFERSCAIHRMSIFFLQSSLRKKYGAKLTRETTLFSKLFIFRIYLRM